MLTRLWSFIISNVKRQNILEVSFFLHKEESLRRNGEKDGIKVKIGGSTSLPLLNLDAQTNAKIFLTLLLRLYNKTPDFFMNDRSCCLVSPRQQLRCCLWKQAVSCASWCAGALGLLSPNGGRGVGWGGFNRSGGRLPARRCTSWCPCWVSGVPGGWWDRGTGRGSPPLWALSLESGRKSGTWCLLRVVACELLLQIWTRERVGKRT